MPGAYQKNENNNQQNYNEDDAYEKSILRISLESAIFAGFVVDAADGACMTCGFRTGVGAEVCMNGFGGTCAGAGEKIPILRRRFRLKAYHILRIGWRQ